MSTGQSLGRRAGCGSKLRRRALRADLVLLFQGGGAGHPFSVTRKYPSARSSGPLNLVRWLELVAGAAHGALGAHHACAAAPNLRLKSASQSTHLRRTRLRNAMPYGRKRGRSSAYGARKGYRKKRRHNKRDLENLIKRVVGLEEKSITKSVSNVAIPATWVMQDSLGIISQGAASTQRVGRKIVMTKILFRYSISTDGALSSTAGSAIRVMLIQDKQCNGAQATASEVFENSAQWSSFYNLNNKGRFRTLYDSMTAGYKTVMKSTSDINGTVETFMFAKKVDITFTYEANAGLISDLTTNNVQLWLGVEVGSVLGIHGQIRVRWTDA